MALINDWQMIVRRGGQLGLSDDSHGKRAVGLNYGRLADYLKMSGITKIYYLSEGEGGRTARPVVVEGDWWDDPFWNPQ